MDNKDIYVIHMTMRELCDAESETKSKFVFHENFCEIKSLPWVISLLFSRNNILPLSLLKTSTESLLDFLLLPPGKLNPK